MGEVVTRQVETNAGRVEDPGQKIDISLVGQGRPR